MHDACLNKGCACAKAYSYLGLPVHKSKLCELRKYKTNLCLISNFSAVLFNVKFIWKYVYALVI